MSDAAPQFTDQQMALIIKRAAELQATGEEPVHTLEAIQQIAQQVGIDPQFVAQAAVALQAPRSAAGPLLFGAPSAYRLARQTAGLLQSADHAALIATIRDHLPEVGEVKEFAGGFEWHAGPSDNKTAITFIPSPKGTVIRVDGRHFGSKFALFMSAGAVTLVTGLAGLGVSPEVGVGLGLGTFALSFTSARLLWNRLHMAGRRKLERLIVVLAEQLGRSPTDSGRPR
jgi:hypothetical protein